MLQINAISLLLSACFLGLVTNFMNLFLILGKKLVTKHPVKDTQVAQIALEVNVARREAEIVRCIKSLK